MAGTKKQDEDHCIGTPTMQVIITVAFFLAFGAILRAIIKKDSSPRIRADRAWLNRLKDANTEFAETWFR